MSAQDRGRARADHPATASRLGLSWTPRTAMIVWGLVHTVIFLGLFKASFRFAAMTYYATGSDTQHVYWPAVRKILTGHLPYIDPHFFVEYPPLATAFFAAPALFHPATLRVYDWLFAVEILAVDLATFPLLASLARRQRISATGAVTAYAVIVPFLGSLVAQRYDLVPATLTLGALLALLDRRSIVAWTLLLLATLMKLYPAALAPLFMLYEWRPASPIGPLRVRMRMARDWRVVVRRGYGLALYAIGLIGSTLIWYALAPSSVARFAHWETQRGIEIESVFGSAAELAHLFGLKVALVRSFGSDDVASGWTPLLKLLSTLVTVGLLAVLYISYARRNHRLSPPRPDAGAGIGRAPAWAPPRPLRERGGGEARLAHYWSRRACDCGRMAAHRHCRARVKCVGPPCDEPHPTAVGVVCHATAVAGFDKARAPRAEGVSAAEARALVTYATLVIFAVLLGSKLLSTQFLLWLVPLLAVQASGPRRVAAPTLIAVAMSQWIFPMNWNPLLSFETLPILVMAARNLLLVAVFIMIWRPRSEPMMETDGARR